MSTAHFIGKAI